MGSRLARLLRQLRASGEAPEVDPHSPYFAHLRLRESDRERDVCIGKATCIKSGVRVVDWRHAPVSKLFYRYEQGDCYEEELGGRVVAGEVVARRTVAIRDAALERDRRARGKLRARRDAGWSATAARGPRLSGGEGAALRAYALGAPAERRLGTDPEGVRRRIDKHLPDIAGLLDPEQFDAIGRPGPGFLVVRGTAGSGKTTVALHRIAYLAYQDPEIDAPTTLFLTLSPALRDYVSHVLPGLGVANVRVLTFPEWAEQQVRRLFPVLPTRPAPRHARFRAAPEAAPGARVRARRARADARPVRRASRRRSTTGRACRRTSRCSKRCCLRIPRTCSARAELRAATDWCRARHEELVAFFEGDAESPAALDAEDDALLLRAWQRRAGPLPERPGVPLRYRHVAVDEVQDFSLLELRVIRDCLADPPSMTLAGDTQQQTVDALRRDELLGRSARRSRSARARAAHAARRVSLDARDRRVLARTCSVRSPRTSRPTCCAAVRPSRCSRSPTRAPASRSSPRRCGDSPTRSRSRRSRC